ncbi:MAG: PIG-L family deacetylase [Acidimicrobiia bacterium]
MSKPLTFMAVHAHPDDEASSTGGVLARYADEGIRTVLVTCTNGELGDGPGHLKPDEPGHDPQAVAAVRLVELAKACEHLNVGHLELLGYHDSGMRDWRHHQDHDHVFANVPLEESVGRLVSLFEQYRPDVVVTYDDFGGYNHPDHVQAHRITVAAAERTGIPRKLYFTARKRSDWRLLRDTLRQQGLVMPEPPVMSDEMRERMESIEARITTTVDTRLVIERKRAALAAHASQLDESWFLKCPPELFDTIFGKETFIRADDKTGTPLPETDLFAGLR